MTCVVKTFLFSAAECSFVNAETRLKDIKKEFGDDPRWKECDEADKEQLLEDRVSGAM